jgi:uncharacterized RDD family membrane protein YckC
MLITSTPAPAGFAGPVSRTIAYVIDAVGVAVTVFVCLTGFAMLASVVGSQARDFARALTDASVLVLPGMFAVYCAVFWTLAGRTPGMALLGIRVVAISGRPLRWYAALTRAILLAWIPIGALWMLVDRRHRAFHDIVARTEVLRIAGGPR